jgi:septum formation protein
VHIVLASTSRYRRALIARLGVPVTCVSPDYDEERDKIAHAHLPPGELAMHLAHGKARSVARRYPDALVIGSDQIAAVEGVRLSKPRTEAGARAQLARLQGKTHRLFTAVAVHHGATGRSVEALDVHELTMRPLTDTQIARYVSLDDVLDCAGAYRVESLGIALFQRIHGDDFTAVVGLPLTKTVALLAQMGFDVLGR